MDNQNKSTSYSSNNYDAYVPTPMPSSQQYITTEFSNIISSNSSSLVNENPIPVTHIQQTGMFFFIIIQFYLMIKIKNVII